jgi:hypothetical protein
MMLAGALFVSSGLAQDPLRLLERDIQGKMYGFLAGRSGAHYVAGQTSDGTTPCPPDTPAWKTKCYNGWGVTENETLGFRHVFWRDGRARGEGIVTDDITGTGHSYWGWEFWRKTKVLVGDLVVNGVVYPTPAPLGLFWRPDRLTATYFAGGAVVEEVKFITADDAMLTRVRVVSAPDSVETVELALRGQSYLNTDFIPTWDTDPPNTPLHVGRNSTAAFEAANNRIHLVEHGTAYAKPGQCLDTGNGPTYPPNDPRNPCLARIGKLMYDGMHIFLSASVPMQRVSINRTADGAMEYNFSLPLSKGQEVVVGWAQGDDMEATARKLQGLSPSTADDVLKRRTSDLTRFLTEQIPQFNSSDKMLNEAYLFGWSVYWMYTLDSKVGGFEDRPHPQSAVANFLGLHLHDTWSYLPMGAWVVDKPTYAYGGVLLWDHALDWVKQNQSARTAFWAKHKGFLPDNFGGPWMSPSGCMELSSHIEPAWRIYETSGDKAFLQDAYKLYSGFFCFDGCQQPCWQCTGNALEGLASLVKMARELGLKNDTAQWQAMFTQAEPQFLQGWQSQLTGWLGAADGNQWLDSFQSFVYGGIPDQWAKQAAQTWLLNTEYGFMPPNETFGAPLLAFSLNGTKMLQEGRNDPWLSTTPITYVVADGLYRHWASDEANQILLGHIKAMSRLGFVVQPEAWAASGDYWGDAWYNWGGSVTTVLPLTGLAGVRYSLVGPVNTSSNATADSRMPGGVLRVADSMPKDMDFIEVKVPITVASKTSWAVVSITQSAGRKQIQVTNNPLPNLILQPWMPSGAAYSSSLRQDPTFDGPGPDRKTWIYRGQDAASQTLTLGSPSPRQRVYIVYDGLPSQLRVRVHE